MAVEVGCHVKGAEDKSGAEKGHGHNTRLCENEESHAHSQRDWYQNRVFHPVLAFFLAAHGRNPCVQPLRSEFKRENKEQKAKLPDLLRTLWIGKVTSFIRETMELNTDQAEKLIETEVATFESLKSHFLDIY